MRALALALAAALAACGGVVEGGDGSEPIEPVDPLADCSERFTEGDCAAREPGWVDAVPACGEFGGYLITGCEWMPAERECLRGPYTWSRHKC